MNKVYDAIDNSLSYINKTQYNYFSRGRHYNREKDLPSTKANLSKEDKAKILHNQKMTPTAIYRIEKLLEQIHDSREGLCDIPLGKSKVDAPKKEILDAVKAEYEGMDCDAAYEHLCSKFEETKEFKRFKDLMYQIRYGYNPNVVIVKENNE